MKMEEIHDLSDRDLHQEIEKNRENLFRLRFDVEMRKIKNHQAIPEMKRDIARMMTVMRERELMRMYGGEDVELIEVQEEATKPTPRRSRLFGRK